MKKGVCVWNYKGNALQNARTLTCLGFDALSWFGPAFADLAEGEGEKVAELLKETGAALTVHHMLPDPENAEECGRFTQGLERIARWQEQYHLMDGLTFDFWYDPDGMMPYLSIAVDMFRGMGNFIACEDTPLHQKTLDRYLRILKPGDRFGMLLDVGHMNLRQHKMELYEPEDFIKAIERIPLPIMEIHLHDNRGRKDDHMFMGWGCLPLDAVVTGLKQKKFDGFVTVEVVQQDWSAEKAFQYAQETRDAFLNCWKQ